MTANTLLLDQSTWDLCLDAYGNIALAAPPYAMAQDAASAIKTFKGEVWYDTALGVPYFGQILGRFPSLSFIKSQFVAAALTVPGVVAAVCYISGVSGRKLTGQVLLTDQNGVLTPVSLS